MIVDLSVTKDTQTAFDFTLAPDQIDLENDGVRVAAAVAVTGKLKKGIVQVDVEGSVSTVLEVECARCLQPVEMPLDVSFKVGFIGVEHYTKEKDAEINVADLEVSISENDKVNLTEIVREQILLNLPDRVFCQENCRGLCQKCSTNRNLIDCQCEEKEVDPRWQGLRGLKIKN